MKNRFGLLILNSTLAGLMALFVMGCNKPQETKGAIPPSTSIGTEIDDSVLTTSVKSALLADADIKSFDFQVETRKGVVQLSGFVDNKTQVERATAIAKGVSGVKSVQNNVSMKGTTATVGNTIDDGIVTAKVKSALLSEASIKSHDIAVVTRKGNVQLSGFVDNQVQIDRAMEITRSIEGVSSVSNEMSIKK